MITSKDNELIRNITKLMSSAKYRREQGCFAAEGVRLCRDGADSGAGIRYFVYTGSAKEKYREDFEYISSKAQRCEEVSGGLFGKIADTTAPQGFLCVFEMRETDDDTIVKAGGRYAALERIQDPSNLGTILRTAEALGVDGVILSDDCCDVFSPKVVRGSMGAVFRLPVVIAEDFTAYIRSLTEKGIMTYASTPHKAENCSEVSFAEGGVMLIGNEGNGLREETIAACSKSVRIEMKGRAESLNAAAAAAILLYRLQDDR